MNWPSIEPDEHDRPFDQTGHLVEQARIRPHGEAELGSGAVRRLVDHGAALGLIEDHMGGLQLRSDSRRSP